MYFSEHARKIWLNIFVFEILFFWVSQFRKVLVNNAHQRFEFMQTF